MKGGRQRVGVGLLSHSQAFTQIRGPWKIFSRRNELFLKIFFYFRKFKTCEVVENL